MRLSLFVLLLAACFAPEPQSGSPCADGDRCPSGLTCIGGICVDGDNAGACAGQPDGTPCGSAATSACNNADTCLAGACVTNEAAAGTACYDCALGGGMCASCSQGTCSDATCTVTAAPTGAVLESPLVGNNGDEGTMFDVVATRTLTITSFETHGSQAGMTEYEIWTKPGTYVGAEADRDQWTRIGAATFMLAGQGVFSPIPISIDVTIPAGQRRAFYLTNKTLNNRYHNGTQVGAVLASSPELTIYEGAGVNWGTDGFAGTNAPRAWEGKIHYTSGGGKTLATAMAGATAADGVMFDVTATSKLKVTLLAAHLAPGTHDVAIFFKRGTRAGAQASDWQPLATIPNVVAAGPNTPTILPLPFEVFLDAGTTTAFYIAPSLQLLVQPGTTPATSAELSIANGAPVDGRFGTVGAPAIPNVVVGYGLCE